MSNLPSNSLQEGEHNLQEMKTKSPAWSSKGYHMYGLQGFLRRLFSKLRGEIIFIDSQKLMQCRKFDLKKGVGWRRRKTGKGN